MDTATILRKDKRMEWKINVSPLFLFTCVIPGGCAFYGHSCFGGHGKRSMPDNMNLSPSNQAAIPLKFIQDPTHFELPANYDNAMDDSYSEESTEQQHDQDLKYAVYGLFRQWVGI